MKTSFKYLAMPCLVLTCALLSFCLFACSPSNNAANQPSADQSTAGQLDTSGYLVVAESEPDTVDYHCTTLRYTVAVNVFDRLVETVADGSGSSVIVPSLAESWEVSDDGLSYTFHLREGATFSNGAALTSSDVLYSFMRLLTHPNACNQDIGEPILGAEKLENGEASELEGFRVLSDSDFTITLEQPFGAFLACLSMPAASIMDEDTTREAGDRFGIDPEWTIGSGPYYIREWEPDVRMLLTANENHWAGPPRNDGVDLRFTTDAEETKMMFDDDKLDLLDLDEAGSAAEYFIHGDIYQNRLYTVQRVGITYIALNESVAPLGDVRVRKALRLSLDRETLLDAVYGGRGSIENGIFPHGLYGYNAEPPTIPFDPEEAKKLLAEAGFPDGFDLTFSVTSSSTQQELTLARLAASMWEQIGVRTNVKVIDQNDFMRLRKSGQLACYSAMWTADYNDPDNFIYTFFGDREKTTLRSLCYPRENIMKRVRDARTITDSNARLAEYQELERIIIQDDAAWIPLFSRYSTFVTSNRVRDFRASWNGLAKNELSKMSLADTP